MGDSMDTTRRWFGPCDPAPANYVMMWSCPARYEVWWEPGSTTKPRYVLFSLSAESDKTAMTMHWPSTDMARVLALDAADPRKTYATMPRERFPHTSTGGSDWLCGLPGH